MRTLSGTNMGRALAGWMSAHVSRLLPVDRLSETDALVAPRHPKPSHAFHVLLVPKKAIASIEELAGSDAAFLADLFTTVQELVKQFKLPAYRLVVNGGEYQDFPQLHFHLISDPEKLEADR